MQTHQPDHYRLLGVPPRADDATIKAQFRQLSRRYHPDVCGGTADANARFQQLSGAYNELRDLQRRRAYDRLLLVQDPLRFVDEARAARALDAIDGVVQRLRRGPPALTGPRDLRVRHTLSFAEAMLGGIKQVEVAFERPCGDCETRGYRLDDDNPPCHVCEGQGRLQVGLRRTMMRCGFCEGRGVVVLRACETCAGRGSVTERRTEPFDVPPRCANGAVLRVRGRGEQTRSRAGDLIVEVTVQPHPLLSADGDDIVCDVPLDMVTAAGGGRVEVPTLDGTAWVRVPPGTCSGAELRVAGAGLPKRRAAPPSGGSSRLAAHSAGRGAARYRLLVDVPRQLSGADLQALAVWQERIGVERFRSVVSYRDALADAREETG